MIKHAEIVEAHSHIKVASQHAQQEDLNVGHVVSSITLPGAACQNNMQNNITNQHRKSHMAEETINDRE